MSSGIKALNSGPFWLNTNQPDTTIVLAQNESRGPISMVAAQRGALAIQYFGASYTSNLAKVRFNRGPLNFQNTDILLGTIFPNGANTDFNPYKLDEPIILSGLDALEVNITNASNATNTISLTMQSSRYGYTPTESELKPLKTRLGAHQMFYTFDAGMATLSALGTLDAFITISNEHAFQIIKKTYVSDGSFKIDITDTATGSSILYAPGEKHYEASVVQIFGNAQRPMVYEEPITIYPGMKLKVSMTDTSGAENRVWITLGGIAIPNGRAS